MHHAIADYSTSYKLLTRYVPERCHFTDINVWAGKYVPESCYFAYINVCANK